MTACRNNCCLFSSLSFSSFILWPNNNYMSIRKEIRFCFPTFQPVYCIQVTSVIGVGMIILCSFSLGKEHAWLLCGDIRGESGEGRSVKSGKTFVANDWACSLININSFQLSPWCFPILSFFFPQLTFLLLTKVLCCVKGRGRGESLGQTWVFFSKSFVGNNCLNLCLSLSLMHTQFSQLFIPRSTLEILLFHSCFLTPL